jgi:hypothetical protein
MVSIVPFVGHIAFNGNSYRDGGAVQFFAQAFNVQAHENVFERTGGLIAWARNEVGSGWGANFRVQFADNVVEEGNHVFNYNTKPYSPPYHPGGSKTVEPWFFASITNDQAQYPGFKGAFNRFIVFRGNEVKSNGGIDVKGTSANVLVEGSRIEQSDVGIHWNTTTTEGGIVLVDNEEPAGVSKNFNPFATKLVGAEEK